MHLLDADRFISIILSMMPQELVLDKFDQHWISLRINIQEREKILLLLFKYLLYFYIGNTCFMHYIIWWLIGLQYLEIIFVAMLEAKSTHAPGICLYTCWVCLQQPLQHSLSVHLSFLLIIDHDAKNSIKPRNIFSEISPFAFGSIRLVHTLCNVG